MPEAPSLRYMARQDYQRKDARIEKLIQRKYQGLRREFVKSYRKMLAENFFGGDIDDINEMNLIDRVNVYFKCGQSAGVRIEKDEQHWIDEIAVAETWEQVVSIADRMFSEAEEKQEEQEKLESLYSVPDEDDDSDNDDVDESEEGEESAQGDDSDEDVSEDSADAESISSNVEEEESATGVGVVRVVAPVHARDERQREHAGHTERAIIRSNDTRHDLGEDEQERVEDMDADHRSLRRRRSTDPHGDQLDASALQQRQRQEGVGSQ